MNDRQSKILRMLATMPRTMRDLTSGNLAETILAKHIEQYVAELEADGLVRYVGDLINITAEGLAEINQPLQLVPSRIYTAASTRETYVPGVWAVRAGSEDHKQHLSRGF